MRARVHQRDARAIGAHERELVREPRQRVEVQLCGTAVARGQPGGASRHPRRVLHELGGVGGL